jgi:protein gp37
MAKPGIEWTGRSDWNPIRGCTRVSEGCRNCYAETIAGRFSAAGQPFHGFATQTENGGRWTGKVEMIKDRLFLPLSWRKPATIFVNSAFDLFHEDIPDEEIDQVFAVMALSPQHTFQVLTKRAKRMREYLAKPERAHIVARRLLKMWVVDNAIPNPKRNITDETLRLDMDQPDDHPMIKPWPLPNVWLGVSVEDQARANERIPDLLATPAAVRWISAEPLLGPLSLDDIAIPRPELCASVIWSALRGWGGAPSKINWVVVGGESGPGARPMHPDWVRSLRDQCAEANVPFFFKQWGEWAPICTMTEDEIDSCYHPAPETRPEAHRREKTPSIVLHYDGKTFAGAARYANGTFTVGSRAMTMFPVGKARAGRLLDGVEHNGFPEVRNG